MSDDRKRWPDIPDVPGITLAKLLKHDLYKNATDEELAYSARCSVEHVRAVKAHLASK